MALPWPLSTVSLAPTPIKHTWTSILWSY